MKKKVYLLKQGIAVMVSVAMLFSCVELPALAAETVTAEEEVDIEISEADLSLGTMGTLGIKNGITWIYDEAAKTLTVSGEDEIQVQQDATGYYFGAFNDICSEMEVKKIQFENCKLTGSAFSLFAYLSNVEEIDLSGADLSDVTEMDAMFYDCSAAKIIFDQAKTDNVYTMRYMFESCMSLEELDLSSFETSSVYDMAEMFYNCCNLKALDIRNFDISNLGDVEDMFLYCDKLETIHAPKMMGSVVIDLPGTFIDPQDVEYTTLCAANAGKFLTKTSGTGGTTGGTGIEGTEGKLGLKNGITWIYDEGKETLTVSGEDELPRAYDPTYITVSPFKAICDAKDIKKIVFDGCVLHGMEDCLFAYLTDIQEIDATGLDTSDVTDMSDMFSHCSSLERLDLRGFKTGKAKDMFGMFVGCGSLQNLDVSSFDTKNVERMDYMFGDCSSLTQLDVSNFDTSNVTNEWGLRGMFNGCRALTSLDLTSFDTSKVMDMATMFMDCSKLTSVDLSSFDTSKVQSMTWMFWGCSSLESLDLSSFHTDALSEMNEMFYGCQKLADLNMSNFNTSKITDMARLFNRCNSLTSLDLSSFDTSNVETMESMFNGCSSLTSLDISGFDTKNVKNMKSMFGGCSSLKSLNMKGLNTSRVLSMSYMFYGCKGLTDPEGVDRLDTGNVTEMECMFSGCSSLVELDLSGLNVSKVVTMNKMFEECKSLEKLNVSSFNAVSVTDMSEMFCECVKLGSLNLEHFATDSVTNMHRMFFRCISLSSLNVGDLNTAHVTDMGSMFEECFRLADLDLSSLDTSEVTDMSCMFYDCGELTDLDVSNFNTGRVESMERMFTRCKSLTQLDLSHFDTRNVTNMYYMFGECYGLTCLDLRSFDTSRVTDFASMFNLCTSLVSLDLSSFDMSGAVSTENIFNRCYGLDVINAPKVMGGVAVWLPGCYDEYDHTTWIGDPFYDENGTSYTTLSADNVNKILTSFEQANEYTVHFDGNGAEKGSMPDQHIKMDASQKLMANTYTKSGFAFVGWNTEPDGSGKAYKDMEVIYNLASAAKETVTLYAQFESNRLGENNGIYWKYNELTKTLIVSGEDELHGAYVHVAPFRAICEARGAERVVFSNCKLTGSARYLLAGLGDVTEIDVSGLDTSDVTDMRGMFFLCKFGIGFDGEEVAYQNGGSELTSLRGLRCLDTSKVMDMSWMFADCDKLTSLDLSGFDTSYATDIWGMFIYCKGLISLDLSRFDTSKVTRMSGVFSDCSSLQSLDLSGFDTRNAITMAAMFSDCKSLTSLDISNFDTSNVVVMTSMFSQCNSLANLDVSGFDTSKVEDMSWMFHCCNSLTDLDVSRFDTSNVTSMHGIFSGCEKLKSLDVGNFQTGSVVNMEGMFSECKGLTELDVSHFDTGSATNISYMFSSCSGLTSLDLSDFVTCNVTDMGNMFSSCHGLRSLDISNFDISSVEVEEYPDGSTSLNSVFWHDESLDTLYAPAKIGSFTPDLPGTFYDETGASYMSLAGGCAGKILTTFKQSEAYKVRFDGNGADAGSMTEQLFRLSVEQTLRTNKFTRTGYTFTGWNTAAGGTGTAYTDKVKVKNLSAQGGKTVTLYAQWSKNRVIYTITYNLNGGTNHSANPSVYEETMETITLEAPTRAGYTFDGWYADAAFNEKVSGIPKGSTGNKTFFAKWTEIPKPKEYTVTFDVNGGSAVPSKTVAEGNTVERPTNPAKDGYTFDNWYRDAEFSILWDFDADTVTEDVTIYAKWTENPREPEKPEESSEPEKPEEPEEPSRTYYVVYFIMNGHGMQVAEQEVGEGRKVKKPADPVAEGYKFLGWYRNVACTKTWDFDRDTIKAATRIYADWEKVKAEEPGDSGDDHYKDYQGDRSSLRAIGAVVGNIKAVTYSGISHEPAVKVTYKNGKKTVTLTEGTDYTVSFKNNVNAGTGEVVVAGCGAYTGEITQTFIIKPKSIKKLKVVVGGMTVNDRTEELPIHVYDGDELLVDNTDYTLDPRDIASSVGKKTVTITGKGNYDSRTSRKVKVTVYAADKVLRAEDFELEEDTWTYTGKAIKPDVKNLSGLDKKYYTVKYSNNKNAGVACVTISGKKGYTGEVVLNFRILPLGGTFHVNNDTGLKAVTYNAKRQKPRVKVTAEVLIGGVTKTVSLKAGRDYTVTYRNNLHATPDESAAFVIITGTGNFENVTTKSASFKINPQDINKAKISGMEDNYNVTYGKQTLLPGTDYTFMEYGTRNNGKVEVKLAGKGDFTGNFVKMVKEK